MVYFLIKRMVVVVQVISVVMLILLLILSSLFRFPTTLQFYII